MRRLAALVCAVCSLLVLSLAGSGTAAGAAPPAARHTLPYVRHGETVPTYSYAADIHESVFVQAPFDSDGDGKPDRIAVDIERPRTPDGVKVPVIMDASPYYQCCGRGNQSQVKTYYADGTIAGMPLFYDNYFVPRGYAVAQVDLAGTSRSTGCGDVGGPNEILGVKAVIDWMNGHGTAVGLDGKPVRADWTTGKVGMIGKSWDGTIANGVAATGVRGLATIVPISAISSWYDYTRFNGVLRGTGYVDYLATVVGDRPAKRCAAVYAAEQAASDDATGDFNAFWAQRDYRLDAASVHASVFVVHGLNDQNVTTDQFASWWSELASRGVPRKIWLHQASHVDPFDIRRAAWVNTLHQWFDYWLQGVHNSVMSQPQASVERPDGHWVAQPSWPGDTHTVATPLAALGGSAERTVVDDPDLSEDTAVAAPTTARADRAVFLSGALTAPLHIAGTPSLRLRVKVDKPTTELSVRLVDYGHQRRVDYLSPGEGISTLSTSSCWGESSAVDSACYFDTAQDFVTSKVDIVTRGWLDAAHHLTLRRTTPLVPGSWYTVTVPIDATDAVFAAGHRLGVVVTLSDEEYTSPTSVGATVVIDPRGSALLTPTRSGRIAAGPTSSRVARVAAMAPAGAGVSGSPHALLRTALRVPGPR